MFARSMLAVALFACASANPARAAEWTADVLFQFVSGGDDSTFGTNPRLGVLQVGKDLYGISAYGGDGSGGVVWRRRNNGNMKVLYSFKDNDTAKNSCGYTPSSQLIMVNGRLYGTTFFGGEGDGGVIFRLTDDGKGTWVCKALKSFVRKGQGRRFGHSSFGGLLLNPVDNRLYGTAQGGGKDNVGVVFRLNLDGSSYKVLYEFAKTGVGGYGPASALAVDTAGRMYGTTFFGGKRRGGTVYRITRGGKFKVFHQFNSNNGRKGYQPTQGRLLVDNANGKLLGATTLGGCPDGDTACGPNTAVTPAGVLFRMNISGGGYKVLYTFDSNSSGSASGYGPYGGLVMKSNGQVFGVAQFGGEKQGGVAFRWVNGNYVVLHSFNSNPDGYRPSGPPVLDGNTLIGTNYFGGSDRGTLFRLQP